jgi:hypothetical protein
MSKSIPNKTILKNVKNKAMLDTLREKIVPSPENDSSEPVVSDKAPE